ncbi:MAG: type II toxin-antitoxin system VapC family toxin [Candidatus Dormibacteria bacterium]
MAEAQVLDTSAFGRAFVEGPDQPWLASLISSRQAFMCLLGLTEARALVSTRVRRGLPAAAAADLWRMIRTSLDQVNFTDLERADFEEAQALMASDPGLRGSDAIHVASAHRVARAGVGVTFITADRRQASAAGRFMDRVRLLE